MTLLHDWQPPLQVTADAVAMMAGSVNPGLEMEDLKRVKQDLEAWRETYSARGVLVDVRAELLSLDGLTEGIDDDYVLLRDARQGSPDSGGRTLPNVTQ